ncbi:major allergen Pru av 1-like [Syzygium oleosum]|uniref:major allergen Pru av 1-like n=1 Tax=Syzygium oleosum TaxID=219896 RepID=UPI0011D25720|nr:major allergen Pru av 1-like [Syzygium oleosum]XP_056161458.1 major allergen Pru av 1-like [Syzygium oleosum]
MGVITYDSEITSSIPPAKMFKAAVLDADNLIPKVLPQAIKSVEVLEGDGGPGTIKLITFGEGSQYKTVKHKVEVVDKENFVYCYSIIEGDALGTTFEKISYETKITASPEGGSVCKNTSKYFTIGEVDITEEKIKAGKEKASAMFKAIEDYLVANPDAY